MGRRKLTTKFEEEPKFIYCDFFIRISNIAFMMSVSMVRAVLSMAIGYLRPCSDTCFYGDEKNGSFENRHNLFLTITKTVS